MVLCQRAAKGVDRSQETIPRAPHLARHRQLRFDRQVAHQGRCSWLHFSAFLSIHAARDVTVIIEPARLLDTNRTSFASRAIVDREPM
jgi:hypothetical protein